MAQPGLTIDINTLRVEVGMRQGWGRTVGSMTATQLADFDRVSAKALREFYFPAIDEATPYYEWSFLRKTGTITLANTDGDYDLPEDFGGTILDETVTYGASVDQNPLHKVPEQQIRMAQARDPQIGYPKYYAVRNKAHAPTTGQRWEMLVYPTPGSTANAAELTYRYAYVPDPLSNTNKYPVGGGQYGELVVAAHLAAQEELLDGDPAGPFKGRFIALLATGVRNDLQQKANNQGGDA